MLLWDTTTNPEYLASAYSRRGLRCLLVPYYFAFCAIDVGITDTGLANKILDGCSCAGMLLIYIFSHRGSMRYDMAVCGLAVANLTLEAATLSSPGVDKTVAMLSMFLFISSVAFVMALSGVHCAAVCTYACAWMMLYIRAVPDVGSAAVAIIMVCVMCIASVGADALSGTVFALVRANEVLLENALNGMCAVDGQGVIRHASEQMRELFGGEALVGQRLADLVPTHQQHEVQVLPLQGADGADRPCTAFVQCYVRASTKVFDCKMICYLRSRNMSLLTLLVVGELRDHVEDPETPERGAAPRQRPQAAGARGGAGGASAGGSPEAMPDSASAPAQDARDGESDRFAVDWTQPLESDLRSAASLALTTSTGGLFPNLVSPSAVTPEMAKLEQLGSSEHWLIPKKDLIVLDGPASWAGPRTQPMEEPGLPCTTVRGRWRGTPVFVKIAAEAPRDTETGLDVLLNELRMLRQVRHPSIACFLGACFDYELLSIALVLEYVEGPTLDRFIFAGGAAQGREAVRHVGPPDGSTQVHLLIQMAQALQHLHVRRVPIIHGNLTASNILVDRQTVVPRPKLFGFGLAQFATKSQTRAVGGDWRYKAPETLTDAPEPPTPEQDMYSFGSLVFLVTTGDEPFSDAGRDDPVRFGKAVRAGSVRDPGWSDHDPSPDLFIRSLSQRCMQKEPFRRLTAPEAHIVLTMHPMYHDDMSFAETAPARARRETQMR